MPQTILSSREMLAKLVSFDTTSVRSNLDLIRWVQGYLDGYGVRSTLIYDETKNKANLHAAIGPEEKPGVVLSGHTDVVPVEGQDWSSDPFTLREHDGLLHARGTCDMKGFIAVALSKVPAMAQARDRLKAPVHFALSYDEELGCLGAHSLAGYLAGMPVRQKLCVVGEPTGMKVITGHKGICDFDCTVHGKEAHSSLAPYAVNAVEAAAEAVAYIRAVARRMASEGPFNNNFDPPFTTLHTGVFKGGTALNIVPNLCEFSFEIRNIPEVDADHLAEEIRQHVFKTIEPRMKEIDPKTGFEFRSAARVQAFDISNDDPAVELVRGLSGANAVEKVSFATEAGIFHGKGIPTVVCGPGHIAQAHKPDEFVAVEQMLKCEHFMDRLIDHLQKAA
jgi:acetylornithine deacetylase